MALSRRLAIIAGGLGGLGSATGKILRSQGAWLALLYAPFEANRTKELLRKGYGKDFAPEEIRTYECDITSPSSVQSAFARYPQIWPRGMRPRQRRRSRAFSRRWKHLNTKLLGPMLCSQAFARLYLAVAKAAAPTAAPPGRIVSVSSQAAHVALWKHGAYCTSKAGLMGLTRNMASEWGPKGITANTVSPTVAWTELG
ncbi:Uu.00g146330.m01.CDS01 [Anthostomella pinea]|uniref:Uu.00g146330.m01.CDS01 n=1 Tax=Anthostomella pinea TaxID=933095 RepID=A0AAI8VR91_9PEZI|nr:Uu.00g146330.m01.CDS01 [Anthostomella pinea]